MFGTAIAGKITFVLKFSIHRPSLFTLTNFVRGFLLNLQAKTTPINGLGRHRRGRLWWFLLVRTFLHFETTVLLLLKKVSFKKAPQSKPAYSNSNLSMFPSSAHNRISTDTTISASPATWTLSFSSDWRISSRTWIVQASNSALHHRSPHPTSSPRSRPARHPIPRWIVFLRVQFRPESTVLVREILSPPPFFSGVVSKFQV